MAAGIGLPSLVDLLGAEVSIEKCGTCVRLEWPNRGSVCRAAYSIGARGSRAVVGVSYVPVISVSEPLVVWH